MGPIDLISLLLKGQLHAWTDGPFRLGGVSCQFERRHEWLDCVQLLSETKSGDPVPVGRA